MKYTKEQLNEKYEMLPKELQEAIFSSESTENVKKIGEKHNLHIDKIGKLGEEIWLTMLGVKRTVDFIKNIKARLNLPDEKINAIAKDVNEKIFLQMREAMKKTQEATDDESEENTQEEIHPVRSNPPEADADQRTDQTSYRIHHPELGQTPHLVARYPSEGMVDKAEESEEIKQQITKQQEVHHTAPPPPNLPIAEPAQSPDADLKARPSSDNEEEVEEQIKPHFEKKKPYSADPYREPIE